MKVSLSWLSAYVPIEMDPGALADALTMVGLEVEGVADRYEYLKKVRVGRIVDIAAHPNSDKLSCCQVDLGDRSISVVCGAPNIQKDMRVPAALPGTLLPGGTAIAHSLIRGVPSEGMLCSESELHLGSDASGIMALDPALESGRSLDEALALKDIVFEIGLTPNRPDCLSVTGIAREIAALQKSRIKLTQAPLPETHKRIADLTSVTIHDPSLCPRYAAGLVENITVGPSPFWLQDRLLSIGLRPINNIVDITNFVMMELGQPLHAFDFDLLAGNRIVVRRAGEGEAFTTLDQKERRLSTDMLMICDAQKPVAIAGIMGGLNSEIESTTRNVLIESAYFDPVSIRKTAKALGLNTDASYRFARGVDPAGTVRALRRAAQLMVEIGGGQLVDGFIDAHPRPAPSKEIPLTAAATNRLLGTRFNADEITALLESIEFSVARDPKGSMVVIPPTFRVDVERPEDLMEEVARLAGYQNIPTTFPLISAAAGAPLKPLMLRNRIKRLMTGFGFTETINYSFIYKNSCDRLALDPGDPRRALLEILNPLTEDQAVMRTSLVPGLLDTVRRNLAQQNRDLKCFEIGKIFLSKGPDELPQECEMMGGLWTGARNASSWLTDDTECDFYDIKGIVEGLLDALGVVDIDFHRPAEADCRYTRPGYTAGIFAGRRLMGLVGRIDAAVLQNFDLKQDVYLFELNLSELAAHVPAARHFQPIARFPSVARDLTVIIDQKIEAGALVKRIRQMKEDLVESILLFAVYDKKPIPEGRKSISIRITYRSSTGTLEDDAVNIIHRSISERIITEFNATLPA